MANLEGQLKDYEQKNVSEINTKDHASKLEEAEKALTVLRLKLEELETEAAQNKQAKASTDISEETVKDLEDQVAQAKSAFRKEIESRESIVHHIQLRVAELEQQSLHKMDTDKLLREAEERISWLEAELHKAREEEAVRVEELSQLQVAQQNGVKIADDLKESEAKVKQLENKLKALEGNVKELTDMVQAEADRNVELQRALSSTTESAAAAEEKLKKLSELYQIEKDAAIINKQKLEKQETKAHQLEVDLLETTKNLEELQIELRNSLQLAADNQSTANLHESEEKRMLQKCQELEVLIERARLKEHDFEGLVKSLQIELNEFKHKALSAENSEKVLKETQDYVSKLEEDLLHAQEITKNVQIENEHKLEQQKLKIDELEKYLEESQKSLEELQLELKNTVHRASNHEDTLKLHQEEVTMLLGKSRELEVFAETAKLKEHQKDEMIKSLEIEVESLRLQAVSAANTEEILNQTQKHVASLEQSLSIMQAKTAELQAKLHIAEEQSSQFESILSMHEKNVDEVRDTASGLEIALASSKNIIKDKEDEIQSLQADLKRSNGLVLEYEEHLKSILARSDERQKNFQSRIDETESKNQVLEEHLSQSTSKVRELEECISDFQSREKDAQEKFSELQQLLDTSWEREAELQRNLKFVQEAASAASQHEQGVQEHVTKLEQKLSAVEIEAGELQRKLDATEGQVDEHQSNLRLHEENASEYLNTIANLEKALAASEDILHQREDSVTSLQAEVEEAKTVILVNEQSLEEFKLKSTELQQNLKSQVDIAESKNRVMEHRLIQSTTKIEELEASILQFEAKAKNADGQIAELEQLLQVSREREAMLQEKLNDVEKAISQHQENEKDYSQRALQLEGLINLGDTEAEKASKRVEEVLEQLKTEVQRGYELEEKLKFADDKCRYHENAGKELSQRYSELEVSVDAFRMDAKELKVKVVELENFLESSHQEELQLKGRESSLQEKLKVMEEAASQHLEKAKVSSQRALNLEDVLNSERSLMKDSLTKTEELQKQLETAVKRGDELQIKLKAAEESCTYQQQTVEELNQKSTELEANVAASHKEIKELRDTVQELQQSQAMSFQEHDALTEKLKATQDLARQHESHVHNLNTYSTELKELHEASSHKLSELELSLEKSQEKNLQYESTLKDMEQRAVLHEFHAKQMTDKLHELHQSVGPAKAEAKESLDRFHELQEIHATTEAEVKDLKEQLLLLQEQVKELKSVKENRTFVEGQYSKIVDSNSILQVESTFAQEHISDLNMPQQLKRGRKDLEFELNPEKGSLVELNTNFEGEKGQSPSQNVENQKLKEFDNLKPFATASRDLEQDSFSSTGELRKRKGKIEESMNTSEVGRHYVKPNLREPATDGNSHMLGMLVGIFVAAFLFGFWTNQTLYA